MKKRVFLGGTQSGSKWRDELIPMLKIGYTSPVVTAHSKEISSEGLESGLADFVLYVVTPMADNFESLKIISTAVQNSNRIPAKTILCVLFKDGDVKFNKAGKETFRGIMRLVRENGSQVFDSLVDLAGYLNEFYVEIEYNPDVVECLIERDGPTEIVIGNTRYKFEKNAAGHYICKVPWREHRDHFLKLGDFRLYQQEKMPGPEFTDSEWDFMREWRTRDAGSFQSYVNGNTKRFNESRGKIKAIAIGKWKALLPDVGCPISLEPGHGTEKPDFVDEWIKLDGVKFEDYVIENEARFMECDDEIRAKAKAKWDRLIFAKTAEPCPMVLEAN